MLDRVWIIDSQSMTSRSGEMARWRQGRWKFPLEKLMPSYCQVDVGVQCDVEEREVGKAAGADESRV